MDAFVTVKAKVEGGDLGNFETGFENKKINVLPAKPDIINQRLYIIPPIITLRRNEK